ncbi:hypothetical protein [Rhodococcus pyridinivorans]|uniref:DUF732 domain-containing protein n=1 Tax=Rhodococcus pyridinivorans TaxID=103816 RepID=A0A7M2XRG9_9NOCA|nr:hypothetical protein [Rhodococcus pyridinivorans]QOV99491.1 hypothetical protein INP59_03555 [Rhodococcus pyridinivorans]
MRPVIAALAILTALTAAACGNEPGKVDTTTTPTSAETTSETTETTIPETSEPAPTTETTEPAPADDGEVVDGQPLGAGQGPGPYVERVRAATGEDVTVGQAVDFARTVCGMVAAQADAGSPDPIGSTVNEIASVPGAPPGAPETVVDAAVRFGCPERL